MAEKKRVLYVDKSYEGGLGEHNFHIISAGLRERYDSEVGRDFGQWVVDELKRALSTRRYGALITHLPQDDEEVRQAVRTGRFSILGSSFVGYSASLGLIRKIEKMDPKLPVMLYTGAAKPSLFQGRNVRLVIEKGRDGFEDLASIERGLSYFFNELPGEIQRRTQRIKVPPKIRREGDSTIVEMQVNYEDGLCAVLCGAITKATTGHNGSVFLEVLNTGEKANARRIMESLVLAATPETRMRVTVTGDKEKSEELARRIYSLMISPSYEKLRDDRFKKR